MRAHSYLSMLAAAAGIALAAAPAAAQRPVATYELRVGLPDRTMPAQVVVADSAGALVATFRRVADGKAIPMIVTVEGADLVLHADTEQGLLQFVLRGQNDGAAAAHRVSGRWLLGQQQGELLGRVKG
ncbi:MAG: hypothetical protein ACXW05_06860 [Gemmatirosa sp.]